MAKKPTYEELEQRVKRIEKEAEKDKQIEQGLAKTTALLEYMLNASAVVFYRCEPSGYYPATFISKNIKQQLGYEPEDFINGPKFWVSHIHPDDAELILSQLSGFFKKGYHSYEYRFLHKDGTYRWMYDDFKLLRDAEGKPIDIIGNWIDITERKQAEVALQESEERYRALFMNNPIETLIVDIEGRITSYNKAREERTKKVLQDRLPELGDMMYTEDYAGKHKINMREELMSCINSGKSKSFLEMKYNQRFLDINIAPFTDGAIITSVDATDRKQAEEALIESEERFRFFSKVTFEAILFHEDGVLLEANDQYYDMFGYKPHELLNRHAILLTIAPESIDFLKSQINSGSTALYEVIGIKKNGEKFPIEVHSRKIKYKGRNVRSAAIRDLTKHKQTEEALRKSEEKYRILVENSYDIAYSVTPDGIITFIGPQVDRFGYAPEDMISKHYLEFVVPEQRQEVMHSFEKGTKNGTNDPTEFQLQGKDGRLHWVETVGETRHDDSGHPLVQIGVLRDIAERKRVEQERKKLEAQLQQAQKIEAIGTLAGGIAHDFNNLLMGIQGNTSLMFQDIDSSTPHYKRLKSIEKQIQSGVKLTSQLLGYARKGKYEVIPINLNQIVNETSDTFGQTKKEIVIHKKLVKDLYAIEADQGQIEQVLLNLFVNAADAMPSEGNLYLETKNVTKKDLKNKPYKPKSDKYVLLIVKDTGIGMNKSTIERIFEPFFTTKEMGRGTGLGLASVYGIIKAHGGYIDVKSKKNTGTTFRVYLPATKRKVKKAAKTSDEFIKGKGTVLLVDDEEIIQDVCKDMLKTIGYKVFSAKDSKEAIEIYRKNQNDIDMVLLDMIMPNISGGEVYDHLKEINPDIKVLLSSGYSIDSEATEILNRGCNGFIQKPFDMKKLSAKISKILNNK